MTRRGRPKIDPAALRHRSIQVRVTSAEWERYEAACAAEGKTLSEVARAAWERLARRSKR